MSASASMEYLNVDGMYDTDAFLQEPQIVQKQPFSGRRSLLAACTASLALLAVAAMFMQSTAPHQIDSNSIVSEYAIEDGIPRIVWAFWFGEPMGGARKTSFDLLARGLGLPVQLVTIDNLKNFVKPEFPLHPGFHELTGVHKADYLRAYFMHVHGGAYHDVKAPTHDAITVWPAMFDKLKSNASLWLAGGTFGSYACGESNFEVAWCDRLHAAGHWCCPVLLGHIKSVLISSGQNLIPDVQGFIARPGTPLTSDWFRLLNKKLDKKLEALKAHPGPPGRCCLAWRGQKLDPSGYPFFWPELLGEITTPVFAKYQDHLLMGLPLGFLENQSYVGPER